MFSSRCDFVRRTMAASANGSTIVRKMTVRCGRPYAWNCGGSFMTTNRNSKIQAPASREIPSFNLQRLAPRYWSFVIGVSLEGGCWNLELPLAYHPQIARDKIDDPGNITRKWLISFSVFLQRHYEQIRLDRLNKIRRNQTSVAADTADLDRDFSCTGG